MEPFMSMSMEGAVRIVGTQPNFVRWKMREPYRDAYYEWATGVKQLGTLPAGAKHGVFTVRFITRYIPVIHKMGTIIALIAFLLGLISFYLTFIKE